MIFFPYLASLYKIVTLCLFNAALLRSDSGDRVPGANVDHTEHAGGVSGKRGQLLRLETQGKRIDFRDFESL